MIPGDFGPAPGTDLVDPILAGGDPPTGGEEEGVFLGPTGRKILIREILRRFRETTFVPRRNCVLPYMGAVEAQVYHMARVIDGKDPSYSAFTLR